MATLKLALVDSIIKYAASSNLDSDAWKEMCITVEQQSLTTLIAFDAAAREAEASFKKQTDSKPLPNAWRSAKSVVRDAIKHSVKLMDGGKPKGKTAVVNELKTFKPAAGVQMLTCPHCGGTFEKAAVKVA